ncbi:ribosomal protein L7/L12 [Batrachochytrium salamandrivorans]|nr:ribosomal protein L7/L12 [Batrachochytrium salamandrivorans]KAJ1343417.1 ribosomal protein L7/L12 [Batrachochytrium salamandrivorans]
MSDVAAEKNVPTKITKIVDQIATLNLLETASLVAALKTRLNIQDVIMAAPQGASTGASGASGAASVAAPVEEKVVEQTSFKVTLQKFDPASKAKVIKEIKSILPGANLVEAKKFVESAPKMIKDNVPKDEAEKIKASLEAVGGTIVLE